MHIGGMVRRTLAVTGVALGLLVISPAKEAMVSFSVMRVFSDWYERDSLFKKKGLSVTIPEGNRRNGWSPLVVTYNDDAGFSWFLEEDAEFTAMYNFPAFSWETGASELYDTESGKYNGFYGAYLVSWEKEEPFGFTREGKLKPQEASLAAEYDFIYLVLSNFDLEKPVFSFRLEQVEEGVSLAGFSDWVRIEAKLTVNGCCHSADHYVLPYLQYGVPVNPTEKELEPVEMTGIMYGRYDKERDATLFLYAACKDASETFFCEENFLKKVKIEKGTIERE